MSPIQVARLVSELWREQGRRRKVGTARWGAGYMEPMVRAGYVAKRVTATATTYAMTEAGSAALAHELAMPLFDAAGVECGDYGSPVHHRAARVVPLRRAA